MIKEYIPIKVQSDNNCYRQIWYIDSSNMSLEELIILRKENLEGFEIPCIDRVISMRTQSSKYFHDVKANNRCYKKSKKRKIERSKKND